MNDLRDWLATPHELVAQIRGELMRLEHEDRVASEYGGEARTPTQLAAQEARIDALRDVLRWVRDAELSIHAKRIDNQWGLDGVTAVAKDLKHLSSGDKQPPNEPSKGV
ncbi:MAG: hypothetical protein AAFR17_06445 [Pseudomonadota bacterium]